MLNVFPERIYLNKKLPKNEPTKGTSQEKPDFQEEKNPKNIYNSLSRLDCLPVHLLFC